MRRILTSLHGRRIGLDKDNNLIINDRLAVPDPFNPAARAVLFDDFFGQILGWPWDSKTGSDAEVVAPSISAAASGMVRMTTGDDAAASMAVDGVQIQSALNWYANKGDLVFETLIKMSAITGVAVYAGFTDQISALEMPIHSAASANTITTNATDGMGFFFDTSMTDDNWWVAGVKNNTDATHADTTIAPVADTYQRLRIEVDTSGHATFYINGQRRGYVENAVTVSVALTPVVAAFSRGAASRNIDLDYIHCAQDR